MSRENPSFKVDYATVLSPEPPVRSLVQQCARFCYAIPPQKCKPRTVCIVQQYMLQMSKDKSQEAS
jgi:hypothetical protein